MICSNPRASLLTPFGNTKTFHIPRGVPPASPLSPLLFTLFLDPLLHCLDRRAKGIQLGSISVNHLDYADPRARVTPNNEDMQPKVDSIMQYTFYQGWDVAYDEKKKDKTLDTPIENSQDLTIHLLDLPPMQPSVDLEGKP